MKDVVNDLAARVEKALMESEDFDSRWQVDVLADGGVITLTGTVPSSEARQRAEAIAQSQPGVAGVTNQLGLDPDLEEQRIDPDDADGLYAPPRTQRPPGA